MSTFEHKIYDICLNNLNRQFNVLKTRFYTDYTDIDPTNVNLRDETGKTLLHHSVIDGRVDCVQSLLEKGVTIGMEDYFHITALEYAIENLDIIMVEILIEASKSIYTSRSVMRKANNVISQKYDFSDEEYDPYEECNERGCPICDIDCWDY